MARILVFLMGVFVSCLLIAGEKQAGECELTELTFTVIPKKNIDEQIREYQPLMALISEGLGMPVEMVRASSYESVIDSVVSGGADIAVLGPAAYMIAHRRNPGIEAFASLAVDGGHFTPTGSFYNSILIVNGDSAATTAGDLQGARIALGDPASTSGALVPKALFPETVGVPFNQFFGARVFTGGHDKAMDTLLAGQADAAFVSSARADEYLEHGVISKNSFRVLWRSPPLHYDPFVLRSDICPEVRRNLMDLMTTPSPRLREFLESQLSSGITRVTHEDYRAIGELIPVGP
jgi:phosphonate transport system substrate-binding protein